MSARKRLGVVAEQDFMRHRIQREVRESPKRMWSLYRRLDDPGIAEMVIRLRAREASEREIAAVHSEMYLSQLRQHAVSNNPFAYDKDTYLMEDTLYVASLAAGGCLVLCDAVLEGRIDTGVALVRPPGHHAGIGGGAGFCVLNHAAILARHLQYRHGLDRILILDVDAHHGNGTQEIFWEDPGVLFLSIHEENLFPFNSGAAGETGGGAGDGYTINIPVRFGFGDLEYSFLLGKVVQEAILQYAPQIMLVSLGVDAHVDDPISSLALTTGWYGHLAKTLGWYVHTYGVGGLVYILEGGYVAACLEAAVVSLLYGMAAPASAQDTPFSPRASGLLERAILPKIANIWRF